MSKTMMWDDLRLWAFLGRNRFKRYVVVHNHRKMSLESLRTSEPRNINDLAFLMTIIYPELDDYYDMMRRESIE